MAHLLVVDDDEDIVSLLTTFFRKHGHTVSAAGDRKGMLSVLDTSKIDIVILDVMLKDEDGLALCRELRTRSRIPVIMLTAVAEPADRVIGLEVGADDYLTKPFDQRELLARVKAVLRRSTERVSASDSETRPILCFDGWRLNVATRELRSRENTLVLLSGGEFELLLAFAEHPQRILSRDQLLDFARGETHLVYDRSIDVLVSRIRHKLESDPKNPALIRTVRNGGYLFATEVTRG